MAKQEPASFVNSASAGILSRDQISRLFAEQLDKYWEQANVALPQNFWKKAPTGLYTPNFGTEPPPPPPPPTDPIWQVNQFGIKVSRAFVSAAGYYTVASSAIGPDPDPEPEPEQQEAACEFTIPDELDMTCDDELDDDWLSQQKAFLV